MVGQKTSHFSCGTHEIWKWVVSKPTQQNQSKVQKLPVSTMDAKRPAADFKLRKVNEGSVSFEGYRQIPVYPAMTREWKQVTRDRPGGGVSAGQ